MFASAANAVLVHLSREPGRCYGACGNPVAASHVTAGSVAAGCSQAARIILIGATHKEGGGLITIVEVARVSGSVGVGNDLDS